MPGRAMSATRAEYGEAHVRRIAVIKALSGLGLSMVQIKSVWVSSMSLGYRCFRCWGQQREPCFPAESTAGQDCSRARVALEILGCALPEGLPVVAQLEQALADAEAAGVAMSEDRLRAYAPHIRAVAAYDIDQMPTTPSDAAVEYAVLGTVLYEPILAALGGQPTPNSPHGDSTSPLIERPALVPFGVGSGSRMQFGANRAFVSSPASCGECCRRTSRIRCRALISEQFAGPASPKGGDLAAPTRETYTSRYLILEVTEFSTR